jgi:hypothetical protein
MNKKKLASVAALILENISEELERRNVFFTGPNESLSFDERDELLAALAPIVVDTLISELE